MSSAFRYGWILLAQGVTACAFVASSFSQQPRSPQMPAPPPMRFVSRDERSQLNSAKDPKARLRAALSLAEGHLSRAETLTQQGKFDQASEEIGSYLALV